MVRYNRTGNNIIPLTLENHLLSIVMFNLVVDLFLNLSVSEQLYINA